jgi:uncharacterized repeat protein (TIGR03803 family)
MNVLRLGRETCSPLFVIALLAGCGGPESPMGAFGTMSRSSTVRLSESATPIASPEVRASASTFKNLFRFDGPDGVAPQSSLVEVADTFYGTTYYGGNSGCQSYTQIPGCGTVFAVTSGGKEKALYSFKGAPHDGVFPRGPLTDVNGVLYGITTRGGNGPCGLSSTITGCGVVFKITTSGDETVLHSFAAGSDGEAPTGGLVYAQGALFGVTNAGGANDGGTIFRITTAGKDSVFYNFEGDSPESHPTGIIYANGAFYGTSEGVCAGYSCSNYGGVFKVTMSGKETTLYGFKGSPDGAYPNGQLVAIGDTFYGTTLGGGASGCGSFGCGTVFAVTAAGKESILHRFEQNTKDGVTPSSGLIVVQGALYGTTCCGSGNSGGIVYKMTTAGQETILHTFTYPKELKDGESPYGAVTFANKLLYGATGQGGNTKAYKYGFGTIFSVAP